MDKFWLLISLGFVIDFTTAYPDLSLGYHYQPGYDDSGSIFLHAPNSNLDSESSSSFIASNRAPNSNQPQTIDAEDSNNFYNLQTTSQGYPRENYGPQQIHTSSLNRRNKETIVTTHFYLHSSPEEEQEEQQNEQSIVRYINVGRPRKNYHVVFIKAPPITSPATKVKVVANVAPVEDKTSIFVLSKQPPAADVSAEVVTQPPATDQNQPEVFFIKYKTPEEELHAQHVIQAQYKTLDDSSEDNDDATYFKSQKTSDTSPAATSTPAETGDNSSPDFQQIYLPASPN